jgi:hypothetical protein
MSKKHPKNANYDFKQHSPRTPMGSGMFANLPVDPIFATFSDRVDMRDGIQNNPVMSVDMLSKVDENMREEDGNDSA